MIRSMKREQSSFFSYQISPIENNQSGQTLDNYYLRVCISKPAGEPQFDDGLNRGKCCRYFLPAQTSPVENNRSGQTIDNYYSRECISEPLVKPQINDGLNEEFASYIQDAVNRYKRLANSSNYDKKPAEPFLGSLKLLNLNFPRITFYADGAKARFFYRQKEFVADYNYEEPDSIFVSTFIDDVLVVKDGEPRALMEILGRFGG
jgi:hypothetical protein